MKLKELTEAKQTPISPEIQPWMFKTKDEIEVWLVSIHKNNYTINDNLTVDIHQPVKFLPNNLKQGKIPVKFNIADSSFDVSMCRLLSLVGCPNHVTTHFSCSQNNLRSFEGGPTFVGGDYTAHSNMFDVFDGQCDWVTGTVYLHANPYLHSFHHIHKTFRGIGGSLSLDGAVVVSNLLGVLKIKYLGGIGVYNISANERIKTAIKIINKHLKDDRNIHFAQEELIEAGLSEYAKL